MQPGPPKRTKTAAARPSTSTSTPTAAPTPAALAFDALSSLSAVRLDPTPRETRERVLAHVPAATAHLKSVQRAALRELYHS